MRNEKFICFFFLVLLLFFLKTPVFAQSAYVLPYPSSMPGSLFYGAHLVYENISKYWYFGDFGQFNYNLKMADKYLVEAKTLFEYRQYLLGYKALRESDQYFLNILPNLDKAKQNNKNISQKRVVLRDAAQKHIEVLEKMIKDMPDVFEWKPEKSLSTTLELRKTIEGSINLRQNDL